MTYARSHLTPFTALLMRRFESIGPLNEYERQIIRSIDARPTHSHRPNSRILNEEIEISVPRLIESGWGYRDRVLGDGRRQIVDILVPGDVVGLCRQAHALPAADVVAFSQLRTTDAPELAGVLREPNRSPALFEMLALISAEQEVFGLNQIVRLGRHTAYERVANWLVELEYRLASRGLATNRSFLFPVTQAMIADLVGLSVVHVNRTLQNMRRDKLVELKGGWLSILDVDALRRIGHFSPPTLTSTPASQLNASEQTADSETASA